MIKSYFIALDPPNVTSATDGGVIVNNSDVIQLFCDVTGIPAPTVLWYLNQTPLQNITNFLEVSTTYQALSFNLTKVMSVVKVINASKSYEGNYSCIGNNSAQNLIDADGIHTISVFVQS